MFQRIHIVGASSSGTTTLGAELAGRLGAAHLDTDDFFWEATDPPFTTKRPEAERVALMEGELAGAVLSCCSRNHYTSVLHCLQHGYIQKKHSHLFRHRQIYLIYTPSQ